MVLRETGGVSTARDRRKGSLFFCGAKWRDWSISAAPTVRFRVRFRRDCVAKLFLGARTKFSRGAGALILNPCGGGSHDQSDFHPAAFVSSLQGIGSPKTRFDGHLSKFCRHLIFEFCNNRRSSCRADVLSARQLMPEADIEHAMGTGSIEPIRASFHGVSITPPLTPAAWRLRWRATDIPLDGAIRAGLRWPRGREVACRRPPRGRPQRQRLGR
jgi:hypothetical protein